MKPLAITMGDSSGVGPEIVLHAFRKGELPAGAFVVGDLPVLEECNRRLGFGVRLRRVDAPENMADGEGMLPVLDMGCLEVGDLQIGRISKASGAAALACVERAVTLALEGRVCGLVTLPVHKEATRLSRPGFTGHTELIAGMCGVQNETMMLVSEKLVVTHVSTHVSLREAIDRVRKERILEVIRLTAGVLGRLRPRQRVAVAGLNPHAGEGGAFGREEVEQIEPAVQEARRAGLEVDGPLPPDTLFFQAVRGRFDAVVCMYHDQGHIPLKLLDFEGGINVTLGLPIVRTSVDHGTAFDIAWTGKAFTRSLRDACALALRLA